MRKHHPLQHIRSLVLGVIGLLMSLQLNAQTGQTLDVTVHGVNGESHQEQFELPESMTFPLDSLLSDWRTKTYISTDTDCNFTDATPEYSDSVYIDRLQRMPTVMEMVYNDVVRKFIDQYTGRLKNHVALMLSAGNFYMPLFEEALEAYGMPIELRYLPIIESALNPKATSRAGAVGLWQFMLKTGKLYGLENDSYVDDRRDPIKSTWAAVRYLKEMYDIYQDWNLVIAAYNCGPGNVNKAITRAGGKTDYWDIYNYLPKETRSYVPSFIAVNYVMTYYCKHNICPMEATLPEATDTIMINQDLHFDQIAAVCGIEKSMLQSLNPQYKRDVIPGASRPMTLRLEQSQISSFISQQDSIYAYNREKYFKGRKVVAVASTTTSKTTTAKAGTGTAQTYKIKSGDTLGGIAKKYGVTVSQLRSWNGISGNKITAGKTLKIYK